MEKLKIEYLPVEKLKPYENNARKHADEDVNAIVESIKEFGFDDPIGIWHDTIVEGHGRLIAAKKLGMETVPVIRLDHLTDEQRRAYTLDHNKTAELSEWDYDMLDLEINDLDLDMEPFGFEIENADFIEKLPNQRDRTFKGYNLEMIDSMELTPDFWQMPIIKGCQFVPDDLIGFNYAKTSKGKKAGIHFFIDDYQFERVWNDPETYLELLSEFQCVLSPDFSLYMDMPMPMKIWNVYRSRVLGAYWQSHGMRVIPTVSWAEAETFKFAFCGIEKCSTVAVSTVGVMKNGIEVFNEGIKALEKTCSPSVILLYGNEIPLETKADVVYFKNKVTERMSKSKWVDEGQRQEEWEAEEG